MTVQTTNTYQPFGQIVIDAINWPLKATLHKTTWWQIDPTSSAFKAQLASRVVSLATLVFAEVISVFSKTLLLMRDTLAFTGSLGYRLLRIKPLKEWAEKQPGILDLLKDVGSIALTALNIPISPIIGFISPEINYDYQRSVRLIPPSEEIQQYYANIELKKQLRSNIKTQIHKNEALDSTHAEIIKVDATKKSTEESAKEVMAREAARNSWQKVLGALLKAPHSNEAVSKLKTLHEEVFTTNEETLESIKTKYAALSKKHHSLRAKLKKSNDENTNLKSELKTLKTAEEDRKKAEEAKKHSSFFSRSKSTTNSKKDNKETTSTEPNKNKPKTDDNSGGFTIFGHKFGGPKSKATEAEDAVGETKK